MGLGYRGSEKWRDMSEYVVHFCRAATERDAIEQTLSILGSGQIRAGGPFGAARTLDAPRPEQRSACFSEIPLDQLDRLVARRSSYGIGFRQESLIAAGGARVWYVDKDSPTHHAVQATLERMIHPGMDVESPFWELNPFIDFPGDYGGTQYRFEWEREWRVPGGFSFEPTEVAFLFAPEAVHENAAAFFADGASGAGPSYVVPFLDPTWAEDRLQDELLAASL